MSKLTAVVMGSALVFCVTCRAPQEPARETTRQPPDGALWLAGSGGSLALARKHARAFEQQNPSIRVVVHPSIGSSGAVRALRDHAIDVGLMTRAPRPAERRALGGVTAIADTEIVLAANWSVPTETVRPAELPALFGGRGRWRDGSRAIPVLRETGDSSQETLREAVPSLGPVLDRMWREERYRIAFHDAELIETVVHVPGSFGVSDEGQNACEPAGARIVRVAGLDLPKHLFLVVAPGARPQARAFVAFVQSAEGRAITASCGYRLPGAVH